jgi:hypothetical protein
MKDEGILDFRIEEQELLDTDDTDLMDKSGF